MRWSETLGHQMPADYSLAVHNEVEVCARDTQLSNKPRRGPNSTATTVRDSAVPRRHRIKASRKILDTTQSDGRARPAFVLPIRNIFNAFETLVSEVHQHGTASESSDARRKIFSTDAVGECLALASPFAFATHWS